ncbi:RNA polymerase sigma factor [Reyranella sp.]|uniref:RNA polymerase sigma factor n=1 Tax=Reyranella sp. TaxID=1929291 RepID=UPI003D0C91B3
MSVPRDRALLALFAAHRRTLTSYANGIVGDRGHAEDIVQEAWLRFDGAAAGGTVDHPVGYLYRIVRNLALDGQRKLLRERRYLSQGVDRNAEEVAEDRPSPEIEVAGRDEIRAMRSIMDELPEKMRIALEMHRLGDCTVKDIADYLGISIGSAHALVVKGLEHCRAALRRQSLG